MPHARIPLPIPRRILKNLALKGEDCTLVRVHKEACVYTPLSHPSAKLPKRQSDTLD